MEELTKENLKVIRLENGEILFAKVEVTDRSKSNGYLEGGKKIIKQIKFLIKNKIPVMGHIGLLPQSVKGKFKSKGKNIKEIRQLKNDALLLQKNGKNYLKK